MQQPDHFSKSFSNASYARSTSSPQHGCDSPGLTITNIIAREILDSRGFPAVEVDVILDNGITGRSAVPSGASTGKFEALEKRDHDFHRFHGKGVRNVIQIIESDIFQLLQGRSVHNQRVIDALLCELDGTENKSKLGANATLAVSMAAARAASQSYRMPLFQYLGGASTNLLPMPLINIINGGAHANNGLDIQEFMIVPVGGNNFMEAMELSSDVFIALKEILKKKGLSTAVGDEGGVAPNLQGSEAALDLLMEAIMNAGLDPYKHIALAMDVAASEFFDPKTQTYNLDGQTYDRQSLVQEYTKWTKAYPLVSIEDPFDQEDFDGFQALTKTLGSHVQIVGDDLLTTHPKRLEKGIAHHAGNAILIKLNQIGTLTETLDVIQKAQQSSWKTIISHRSGETEDTFIADLAVATGAGQIKTGSLCRSERTAKYNQLLRIEESLGTAARFSKSLFRTV